ncbi:MAG: hypothetical protein U1G07_13145 [Verrucomicrobiota bacterium]
MSGRTPGECDEAAKQQPGTEKCIALVYEGAEAVHRSPRCPQGRRTLPNAAELDPRHREFGQTVMVNAAHASDSEENAQREMKIIGGVARAIPSGSKSSSSTASSEIVPTTPAAPHQAQDSLVGRRKRVLRPTRPA